MAGVDDPVLSNADHVGYPRITLFNANELRRCQARIYLPKTGRRDGFAVDARGGIAVVHQELPRKFGGRVGPIVEPDNHAVVVDLKRYQGCGAGVGTVPRSVESGDNFAVVDPVEGSEIHRRLPMFGRHDDRGATEESPLLESAIHLAKGLVNEVERVGQDRPGSRAVGKIAAKGVPRQVTLRSRIWQLLAGRNGLEIHSKDRRRSWVTAAIMPVTIDPVDNGLNFLAVVLLGEQIVRCPVRLVQRSRSGLVRATVDLGRKAIVDAFPGRTGQGQVGGMLVRPRRQ